jgi:DNA-binding MarR family transcriptional regulator
MDPKPQPNQERYLEVLRSMSPADRLRKAFELTEMSRRLFRQGLRKRFPNLSEAELHRLYIERLRSFGNQED